MNSEIFKNIAGFIETKKELKESKRLINECGGCVSMTAYDAASGLEGKKFGPRGYVQDEYDAVRDKIRQGCDRVVVSGSIGSVTIVNRNK